METKIAYFSLFVLVVICSFDYGASTSCGCEMDPHPQRRFCKDSWYGVKFTVINITDDVLYGSDEVMSYWVLLVDEYKTLPDAAIQYEGPHHDRYTYIRTKREESQCGKPDLKKGQTFAAVLFNYLDNNSLGVCSTISEWKKTPQSLKDAYENAFYGCECEVVLGCYHENGIGLIESDANHCYNGVEHQEEACKKVDGECKWV